MSKKISLILFAGVFSLMSLSGCKVFNKKKCDCPKFSEANNSEESDIAMTEEFELQ